MLANPLGQVGLNTSKDRRKHIMQRGVFWYVTAIIISPFSLAFAAPDTPTEVKTRITQVLTAVGGEAKLLKLFRIREQLNVSSDPNKKGSSRVSVLEPPRYWWVGKRERVSQDKEPATYLIWAWTLQPLLDDHSVITILPDITEADKPALGLRISGAINPPMDLYFDASTKRLLRIDWRSDIHRFSDWKEHDGVWYPARCIGYKRKTGKPWYYSQIMELERLRELPTGLKRE